MHALYTKIGSGHDSDLPYLFQWDDFEGQQPTFTPEQQALAVAMGRYFGHFAASGDPNTEGLPRWSPTNDSQTIQYLETASTGGVRSVPTSEYLAEHKVAFWRALA